MRKFTTLATTLLLGGLGFMANAAVSGAVANPATGSSMEVLPDDFTISWNGESVALNPEYAGYQDWGGGMVFAPVQTYVDGKSYDPASAEINEEGNGAIVYITFAYNYGNDFPGEHLVSFSFPEGMFLIGADQEENEAFEVSYTVGDESTAVSYLPMPEINPADGSEIDGSWIEPTYLNWEYGEQGVVPADPESCYALVMVPGEMRPKMVDIYFDYSVVEDADGNPVDGPAYSVSIDWGSVAHDDNWLTITGEYQVIIEKGMIVSADDSAVKNEEIELNYIVMGSYGKDVVTPAYGTDYIYPASALSDVTVKWEGKTSFTSVNSSLEITATLRGEDQGGPLALAAVTDGVLDPDLVHVDAMAGFITLDLSGLEDGTWNIVIPKGYVNFDEYTVNNELTIEYVIFDGLASATILQPGDIVNEPVPVNLTWGYETVSPVEGKELTATLSYSLEGEYMEVNVPASAFSFANTETGEGEHEPTPYADGAVEGNVLSINVVDLLEGVTGYVTISIPEGIVANAEGKVNPAQSYQFQIIPAYNGEYSKVLENNVLTLTWANPEDAESNLGAYPNATGLVPFIIDAEGEKVYEFEEVYTDWSNTEMWDGVVFNLPLSLANGDYTLVVPDGSVYIEYEGNKVNPEIQIGLQFVDGVYSLYEAPEVSYLPTPVISPADEAVMYGWPKEVVFSWDEPIVAVSSDLAVSVSYNGGEAKTVQAYVRDGGAMDEVAGEYIPAAPYELYVDWAETAYEGAGEYTITVPAGLVKNEEGAINPVYVLSYIVYATQGCEDILPDPNAWIDEEMTARVSYTSAELSEVLVVFKSQLTAVENAPQVTCIKQGDAGVDPHAVAENGILNPELISVEGCNIVLDLSGLTDGEWFISIPAGYAQINETTYTSAEQFSYVVNNGMGEPEIIGGIVNLATYTTMNLPEYALVTWGYEALELVGDGEVVITVEDRKTYEINTYPAQVVLRHAEPEVDGGEASPAVQSDEEVMNALEIIFGDYEVNSMSWVTISVPAGLVSNGTTTNNAFTIDIDVMPVYEEQPKFTNIEGLVNVEWEGMYAYVNMDGTNAYVSTSEGTEIELTYGGPWDDVEDPNITPTEDPETMDYIGLLVDLNSLELEDGEYTLWLPLGYVTIHPEDYSQDWYNMTAFWQFHVEDGMVIDGVSGVAEIGTDLNAAEGVYNLQGVKVGNSLEGLSNGIYIVNGKKVLIRK